MKIRLVCRKCFDIYEMQVPIIEEDAEAKFYHEPCGALLFMMVREKGDKIQK